MSLAVLIVGCSNEGRATADPGDIPRETVAEPRLDPNFADPTPTTDANSSQTDTTITPSPVGEALGAVTDPNQLAHLWEISSILEAEHVTLCLAEEGFDEYIEQAEPTPSAEQFASAYDALSGDVQDGAYGVTVSLRGQWRTQEEETVGDRDSALLAYLDELGESGAEQFRMSRAECRLQAQQEFPRPQPLPVEVAAEIAEVRGDALAGSPEWVDVQEAWSSCMAENGYAVANREEARALVEEEALEVTEFLQPFFEGSMVRDEAADREFQSLIGPVEEMEGSVAMVDLDCAVATGEAEVRRDLVWAAEQAWVDENADRIALVLGEVSSE
jgi:hypothetical protein